MLSFARCLNVSLGLEHKVERGFKNKLVQKFILKAGRHIHTKLYKSKIQVNGTKSNVRKCTMVAKPRK